MAPPTRALAGPGKNSPTINTISQNIARSPKRYSSKSRKHYLFWPMRPSIERLRAILSYDPETGIVSRASGPLRVTPDPETGYLQTTVDGCRLRVHIICWALQTGAWPEHGIDHRELPRSDNRWSNLRQADHAENGQNRGKNKNNQSGYKGISLHKHSGLWKISIMVRGKTIYLGYRKTKEEAAEVYRRAAEKYHGEFAYKDQP